jgi:hypothetical protein
MGLAIAIFLKGFVALGFLLIARLLGRWIIRRIPEGKLKRVLLIRW